MLTDYLSALRLLGFDGDVETSIGARVANATDNSIYQLQADAILYPRNAADITLIVQAAIESGTSLPITARGGATGTNGQSLNTGLIVDTSRYLNRITALDLEKCEVTVEPGVTLEQLNRHLARYGLFFPPDVSSGSRATLGGMVATDASGKGSRIWGKTSDYIQQMRVVLADASALTLRPFARDVLESVDDSASTGMQALKSLHKILLENKDHIQARFPALNRGLTGYNLKQALAQDDGLDPRFIFAGSEGTLALTTSMTLRVAHLPACRALIVVLYQDFMRMLSHINALLQAAPAAIEILDDKILARARQDSVWQQVDNIFSDLNSQQPLDGLAFIEILAEDAETLRHRCQAVEEIIAKDRDDFGIIGSRIETSADQISGLWGIRRRAVGLLGAVCVDNDRRPLAFVEDTAVPPDQLTDYIRDFRRLLDQYGLQYGMYGHADVGCLHVRPALNMREPDDRKLIRNISDDVAQLVRRYGGVFWGEHGKGFRGEYAPLFFGDELLPVLSAVKAVFDPGNRFNPGKLASPENADTQAVTRLDQPPMRGSTDAKITPLLAATYAPAIACNGNALCQNLTPENAMCPSYKALRDKRHSPKGRAAMMREWLRRQGGKNKRGEDADALTEELFDSLQHCLSCKSCTHSCPLTVDIPEMKSRFLEEYYVRKKRPFRDYLFSSLETISIAGRRYPRWVNLLLFNRLGRLLQTHFLGIVEAPVFLPMRQQHIQSLASAIFLKPGEQPPNGRDKSVILLPDSFNASFDGRVLEAACILLNHLGHHVFVAPVLANGKALHVKGFRRRFRHIAASQRAAMQQLADSGYPLLSLDVATRMMHAAEYSKILDDSPGYRVDSLEQWLLAEIGGGLLEQAQLSLTDTQAAAPTLLPHCMEQTADQASIQAWQGIFQAFGIALDIKTAGCCGMSGLFGHERDNADLSATIFRQNWQPWLQKKQPVLASGFSCRCQLRRFGYATQHPVEWLAQQLS